MRSRVFARSSWPAWVAGGAVVAGALLRMELSRDAALWGDEYHSLRAWRSTLPEKLSLYDGYGSGLALPLLQHLAVRLLGETTVAVRVPALAGGIGGLLAMYPVGRRVAGAWPAALATVGLALSPLHLFYAHFGRSYSLVVLLALVLADGIRRLAERPASRAAFAEVAGAVALLPWVHLTGAAVVVAGAVGAALATPRGARRPLALAFVLGALGCIAVHLPARESFREFVGAKAGGGQVVPFGALDVAAIVGGSRAAGAVWLAAVPAAALAWLRARGAEGAPVVALAVVPVALLALGNPTSNAYAFSRYLIGVLPFALLLLGWGALRAGERAVGGRRGRAVGAAVLVTGLTVGAGSPLATAFAGRDGPFANTYLGLHPSRAFDAAPPFERSFYRAIRERGDVSEVVEVPPAGLGGALLYRAYARQHGKPVRLGFLKAPPMGIHGAAYVPAHALPADCRGTRSVVAHRSVKGEVRSFLASLEGALAAGDASIAEPLVRLPITGSPLSNGDLAALRQRFGPPAYESDRIVAWDVPCRDGPG